MKTHELSARTFSPASRAQKPAAASDSGLQLVPQRRMSLVRLLLLASIAALLFLAPPLFAAAPQSLDVLIKGIEAPAPPRMVDDVLILSFRPKPEEQPVRSVAARFAHENYRLFHPFSRNAHGVFVLDYAVPEGVRDIRYRIMVDGLWMSDPANPRVDFDALGTEFSLYTLEREPPRAIANPRREPDGRLTFTFRGPPGRRVSIAGDWNGWDPFVDFLTETEAGLYRISLRMLPGRHWYYFITEGRRVLDAYNPATGTDPDGFAVSYFSIPG